MKVSQPKPTKPWMDVHNCLAAPELDWKKLDGLVQSKIFESLLPKHLSQSRDFVEKEIASITSLPDHDNLEYRDLMEKLESTLQSMLDDIETIKGLQDKKKEKRMPRTSVR